MRGIGDLEGDEGVDDVAPAVAHLHADVLKVEAEQPVLDDLNRVDEVRGQLEIDAGLLDDARDLAEAQDQRLLARIDDEDRRIDEEGDDRETDQEDGSASHWPAPVCAWVPLAGADWRGRRRPVPLQLIERQIGKHAGSALQDDLVGIAEHLFHRLQIETGAGHVLGLLVFGEDREEALRFAFRLGHDLLLVALRRLRHLRRLAARVAEPLVGVLLGLALEAVEVLLRALHLLERVGDFGRRIGALKLHADDGDAGVVSVERLLKQFANALFHLGAALGAHFFRGRAADKLAHGAFRHAAQERVRLVDVEQILLRIAHPPQHREIDVDDVLVAGEHQAGVGGVAARGVGAEELALHARGDLLDGLHRPEDEMQALRRDPCFGLPKTSS